MLRQGCLTIALLVMLAAPACAEQIYIYDRPGFVGGDFEATDTVPDLSNNPVTTRAASLRARTGAWLVCTQPNFQGNCLWIAHSQISDLTQWGLAGNVRSVRLYRSSGPRFHWPSRLRLLFGDIQRHSLVIAENDYRGDFRTLTQDVPDLAAAGIDFPVGGFIVTGRPSPHAWQLCSGPGYTGRCIISVDSMDVMAELFTDRIASIRGLPLHAPSTDPPRIFRRHRWR